MYQPIITMVVIGGQGPLVESLRKVGAGFTAFIDFLAEGRLSYRLAETPN